MSLQRRPIARHCQTNDKPGASMKKHGKAQSGEMMPQQTVIITGVGRSGTSILGSLVASLLGVEFVYEPWFLAQLPLFSSASVASRKVLNELLRGYTANLFYDNLMGRGVNFRPGDASRVFNYQPERILNDKWKNVSSHGDVVAYAKQHRSMLVMKMINLQPFYDVLFEALPNLKIIHIVRNPVDVAFSIEKKKWLSDRALEEEVSIFPKKTVKSSEGSGSRAVPWWLKKTDLLGFSNASEYERSLMCWCSLLEAQKHSKEIIKGLRSEQYFECKYEELLQDAPGILKRIAKFLDSDMGPCSKALLKTIDVTRLSARDERFLPGISRTLSERSLSLAKEYGYVGSVPPLLPRIMKSPA